MQLQRKTRLISFFDFWRNEEESNKVNFFVKNRGEEDEEGKED